VLKAAEARMQALRQGGYATSVRYDRRSSHIVIGMSTGVQVAIPARKIEGLAEAAEDQLEDIRSAHPGEGGRPKMTASN
jgi:hypothetical protein